MFGGSYCSLIQRQKEKFTGAERDQGSGSSEAFVLELVYRDGFKVRLSKIFISQSVFLSLSGVSMASLWRTDPDSKL